MKYCFGTDIGGTTVKIGLFSSDSDLLEKWEIPTRRDKNGINILSDIADSINSKIKEKCISHESIVGIGVGVPAPIKENGFVAKAANLGWENADVIKTLNSLTGLIVKTANDANAAALGEMRKGSGQGSKNLIMITLGTGIGGGIVVNGKILNGVNGAAGEIGHITVNYNETEKCGCGKCGCLEQYASATGIVRIFKEQLSVFPNTVFTNTNDVSAKDVFDAVKNNDPAALKTAEIFAEYLGAALANIAALIDPEVFVIGGGVSKAGNIIIDLISKYYSKYSFFANRNVKFALSSLRNDAGIYGCANLILQD